MGVPFHRYQSRIFSTIIAILIGIFLYTSSLYNYLLFHSLAEFFSISIAFVIFVIAWNSRKISDNNYFLFIGFTYLFTGSLDFIHTLAYPGMNIFTGFSTNLATQLWISARYLESISFLIGSLLIGKSIKRRDIFSNSILISYSTVFILLLVAIFTDFFPTCFIEGEGLTVFKIVSEYIIIVILLISSLVLIRKREYLNEQVLYLMLAAIYVTLAAEFCFTLYGNDPYGVFNQLGHYLKIISFYLVYRALVVTSFHESFNTLFYNLKKSENRHRALLTAIPNLIFQVNKDNTLGFYKEAKADSFMTPEELSGKKIADVMPEEVAEQIIQYTGKALQTGELQSFDYQLTVGGKSHHYEARLITSGEEEILVIIHDITERKQVETVLKEKKEDLEFFLRIITHDLKNHHLAILKSVELARLVLKGEYDQDIKMLLDHSLSGIISADELLNNIAIMLKKQLSSSHELQPVNVRASVDRSIDLLPKIFPARNIRIKTDKVSPSISVLADSLFDQLLINLLTNAVKSDLHDEVELEIMLETGEKDDAIILSVIDNGVGIPPEKREKIFAELSEIRQKESDSGLGSFIIKTLVHRYNGKIWIEDRIQGDYKQGTRIKIELLAVQF
ncbi:MAG: MASE3 domain-containing protein [Candidatus Odinarchaeota archaeon]